MEFSEVSCRRPQFPADSRQVPDAVASDGCGPIAPYLDGLLVTALAQPTDKTLDLGNADAGLEFGQAPHTRNAELLHSANFSFD